MAISICQFRKIHSSNGLDSAVFAKNACGLQPINVESDVQNAEISSGIYHLASLFIQGGLLELAHAPWCLNYWAVLSLIGITLFLETYIWYSIQVLGCPNYFFVIKNVGKMTFWLSLYLLLHYSKNFQSQVDITLILIDLA